MANTGYLQAIVAYSVSKPGGDPLDINGVPISISGKKQAIALLAGADNPDPSIYEVAFIFSPEAMVTGNATIQPSLGCATGLLKISPISVVLTAANPTVTITLYSYNDWELINATPAIATANVESGGKGMYSVTLMRTATLGQRPFNFRDIKTGDIASVYVVNVDTIHWVLNPTWDDLGFWQDAALWIN